MIVIGIDPSYKRTGICVGRDNKLLTYKSLYYSKIFKGHQKAINNPIETRKYTCHKINQLLNKIVSEIKSEDEEIKIIIERIRLFSHGFINFNYIIEMGGMFAEIIDLAADYNITVYSVDTRSWKSQIVGTSKPLIKEVEIKRGKNKGKMKTVKDVKTPTMQYVMKKYGINLYKEDESGDDDLADAICMCEYGFLPTNQQKLIDESRLSVK